MIGDVELIKRLNESDKDSFEMLYDRYVGMVYSFLNSLLKNESLAQDYTQWCFMQLWEHRHSISSDRNLPAWLYVTARNAAYKEVRRQVVVAKYVELSSKDIADTREESTAVHDFAVIKGEMSKYIDKLPEARRRIFIMRMEEGKSVNEIAQELGISPKTVETQIARAKSFLKEHVSELLYLAFIIALNL